MPFHMLKTKTFPNLLAHNLKKAKNKHTHKGKKITY